MKLRQAKKIELNVFSGFGNRYKRGEFMRAWRRIKKDMNRRLRQVRRGDINDRNRYLAGLDEYCK